MAPCLKSPFDIDDDLFENLGIQAPIRKEMIDQFVYIKIRFISERSFELEKLQEFQKHVFEFNNRYHPHSFFQLLEVYRAKKHSSGSVDNSISGLHPHVFMDMSDQIKQAEILASWRKQEPQIEESSGNPTTVGTTDGQTPPLQDSVTGIGDGREKESENFLSDNFAVETPIETQPNGAAFHDIDTDFNIELQSMDGSSVTVTDAETDNMEQGLLSQRETSENSFVSAPEPVTELVKLGKTFFPLTVQASLSLLTFSFSSSGLSSSTDAKILLQVAAASNLIGYFGCLIDILFRQTNSKVANVMGKIGSTAAVFGFVTTMGTLLAHKPAVSIGVAALVALLFFGAVTKL